MLYSKVCNHSPFFLFFSFNTNKNGDTKFLFLQKQHKFFNPVSKSSHLHNVPPVRELLMPFRLMNSQELILVSSLLGIFFLFYIFLRLFFVCLFIYLFIYLYRGTIIRTGIKCKNIYCYMCDPACKWFIIQNTKIFQSHFRYF